MAIAPFGHHYAKNKKILNVVLFIYYCMVGTIKMINTV